MKKLISLFLTLLLCGCAHSLNKTGAKPSCEIGIVGGGPAGVYTAYQLSKKFGDKICLFEKEEHLGGRMRDEQSSVNGQPPVWVGTGARRVNASEKLYFNLAKEFGIELQLPPKRSQLIFSKGRYGYSPDDYVSLFPGLKGPFDKDPNTTREDEIYNLIVSERARAGGYANLRDYIRALAGPSAVEYLRTVSRWHSDFDYDISAANYAEFMVQEMQTSSDNYYAVGGMGAFIRAMTEQLEKQGVQIFTSEPVNSFEANSANDGYVLRTPKQTVAVRQLILAVPPTGFKYISGSLAEQIRSAPEYQALLPIRVAVINQWWKEPWWLKVRNPKIESDEARVWRAWSTETCVTEVEIPQEPYLQDQNVTRSVYSDDPKCVQFWEKTMASGGIPAVEREVGKGLQKIFRRHVKIPRPTRTTVQIWPGAWFYVRAGAKVTNAQIAQWSIEPIKGRPNLTLIGEAYWVNRPGYSMGAYRSSNQILAKWYGIHLDD